MAALGKYLRTIEGGKIAFWCPGCKSAHAVFVGGGGWTFNGNAEHPTFSPSVLVRNGHFLDANSCWCKFNAEHPDDPAPFRCEQCHSFVTNGQIQFLGDCSHELAGKTVPLPEFPCPARLDGARG